MKGIRRIFVLLLGIVTLGIVCPVKGYSLQPDQRTQAVEWFNNGQYDKALAVFSAMTVNFSSDLLLKYYFGASLIETGNYISEAEKNLILSSTGEVPAKVYYYLGRYYHAKGDWNNAQRFYNRFKNYGTPPEITELRINELSELCFSQINPFAPVAAEIREEQTPDHSGTSPDESAKQDSEKVQNVSAVKKSNNTVNKMETDTLTVLLTENQESGTQMSVSIADTLQPGVVNPELQETPVVLPAFIEFQITNKVTYITEEMFHRTEARVAFQTAVVKEKELDCLLREVKQLRRLYHSSVMPVIRDSLAIKIQNLEYRNLVLNRETDQHYNQARQLEQEWWKEADERDYQSYEQIRDSLLQLKIKPTETAEVIQIEDSLLADPVSPDLEVNFEQPENNNETGEEVIYKIQIGAFDKGLSVQRKKLFEKLEKIRPVEHFILENGVTIYTTGNLKNFGDAIKLQNQVRQEGIKDAFVIAIKDGKRIPLPAEN